MSNVDREQILIDRIEEVRKEYAATFKEYAKKCNDVFQQWCKEFDIPDDLQHSLSIFATEIADCLAIELLFEISIATLPISDESDDKNE